MVLKIYGRSPLSVPDSVYPISEIVAMLAHQINSPLSCILSSAELSMHLKLPSGNIAPISFNVRT